MWWLCDRYTDILSGEPLLRLISVACMDTLTGVGSQADILVYGEIVVWSDMGVSVLKFVETGILPFEYVGLVRAVIFPFVISDRYTCRRLETRGLYDLIWRV